MHAQQVWLEALPKVPHNKARIESHAHAQDERDAAEHIDGKCNEVLAIAPLSRNHDKLVDDKGTRGISHSYPLKALTDARHFYIPKFVNIEVKLSDYRKDQ